MPEWVRELKKMEEASGRRQEGGDDLLLKCSEGAQGAGAGAGVAAGDVVEFVEGFGDGADGEGGVRV